MTTDYRDIPLEVKLHFKGGDGQHLARMLTGEHGKIMHGTLRPGCSIGVHTHQGNYEVIYVISGRGTVTDDGTDVPVGPGAVNVCLPGHSHGIRCSGDEDLVFFAVIPNV